MKGSHAPYSILHARRGQILVESLVALGVLTTGFMGMLALISRSIGLNRVVSENYTATYLAAEGIEVVKNLADADVLQQIPWTANVCSRLTGAYEVAYDTMLGTMTYVGDINEKSQKLLQFDDTGSLSETYRFYQYKNGPGTNFIRTVRIDCTKPDEIKVNSIVDWSTRGGGSFEVNLEDHFLNWR